MHATLAEVNFSKSQRDLYAIVSCACVKEFITLQLFTFLRPKECITLQSVARVSHDCKSHAM
jgi:hypothetical protein